MIGYIQGEVLEYREGKLLVGVGERKTGILGYCLAVAERPEKFFEAGQFIELFVYTHVREEAFDLYGFTSRSDKEIFLTLLSVNGIGPKSALGILSATDPSQLAQAIVHGDQEFLTQIPGIGKKTAERVMVELRDSMRKKLESGLFSSSEGSGLPKTEEVLSSEKKMRVPVHSSIFKDAKEALVSLGYREQVIQQLLTRVLEKKDFYPERAEELVRTALKQLS